MSALSACVPIKLFTVFIFLRLSSSLLNVFFNVLNLGFFFFDFFIFELEVFSDD